MPSTSAISRTSSPSEWTTARKYVEKATDTGYEWESNDFNPNYGGINRHVWLHVTGPIHQTLPLYDGLETTGIYVYPVELAVADRSADVNVESEVANESADAAAVSLSVAVVDADGHVRAHSSTATPLTTARTAKRPLQGHRPAHRRSPVEPRRPLPLRHVYTILTVERQESSTSPRPPPASARPNSAAAPGKGGVYINDKFHLPQRLRPALHQRMGRPGPGLSRLDARLHRRSWSATATATTCAGCTSPRSASTSTPSTGPASSQVCPAGDKERTSQGRQWEQRVEVMRDSMIYFRNNPSILFWEAGNNGISADHMKQMVDLQSRVGPARRAGDGLPHRSATQARTPLAEYFGVMIGQDAAHRRTQEAARHVPRLQRRAPRPRPAHRRPKTSATRPPGVSGTTSPRRTSASRPGRRTPTTGTPKPSASPPLARTGHTESNRISNPDPAHSKWSGYASIYFSDSNADGRQDSSEVCRVSGKVDAVRLPKEATSPIASCRTQSRTSTSSATGPTRRGRRKPSTSSANCDSVELFVNGKSLGKVDQPDRRLHFRLPRTSPSRPARSKPSAIDNGKTACPHELERPPGPPRRSSSRRSSAPAACRPTARTWPCSMSKSSTPTAAAARPTKARSTSPSPAPASGAAATTAEPRLDQQPLPEHRMRHQPRRRSARPSRRARSP